MTTRKLTRWQIGVIAAAAALMLTVGAAGAWGTYTNAVTEFHRQATAAGVVAAGEGLTLILGMVMLGRTMLGQSSPAIVRAGMWLAPLSAAGIGVTIATSSREAAVYAVTPLAMSGAAEGLSFIARSVVIYTTGVDAETLRRNADVARRLAYHRAVADGHPGRIKPWLARRRYWQLAQHVGVGDTALGEGLVDVQRHRVRDGADMALATMYGAPTQAAAAEQPTPARPVSATDALRKHFADMDPAEAIRLAHDARPDAPPAELAHLLGTYGLPIEPVAVALVLGQQPPEYEVKRDDADDAPQVSALPRGAKSAAIRQAASTLGDDARPADIVREVAHKHQIKVDENYVRAVMSRTPKAKRDPGNGGYA